MFYKLWKKTKLELTVDGNTDELGFCNDQNEQLATQQGEREYDRDSENDEEYGDVTVHSKSAILICCRGLCKYPGSIGTVRVQ